MDIASYLLGKSKGGGSTPKLQTKNVTVTQNGETTVSPDEEYDGLEKVNITANVETDLSDYFTSSISAGSSLKPGLADMVKKIPSNITVAGTSLYNAFAYCTNITEIPLFDTSSVTNWESTFRNCTSLTSIPLFNTSNATSMKYTFGAANGLSTIPLFNTSNVSNMEGMFYVNKGITTLPLFDTSNVTQIRSFCNGCTNLTSVPQFNLSKVTNSSSMFQNCTNLTTVPQFNMPLCTNINSMFDSCTKLTNDSINNIMGTAITMNAYTGAKQLSQFFGGSNMSSYYPASMIQGLSNYQDFINAGWTIGWS